jgi:hypothetical protein
MQGWMVRSLIREVERSRQTIGMGYRDVERRVARDGDGPDSLPFAEADVPDG